MKKVYVSPISKAYKVRMATIMAGSLNPLNDGDQEVTLDENEPSPEEFTSRRNRWDDEEETSQDGGLFY